MQTLKCVIAWGRAQLAQRFELTCETPLTRARSFRTITLLAVVGVMSLFDLAFTQVQAQRGNFAEANVVAASLVQGPGAMIAYKVVLFGAGALILYRLRRRWESEAGLWVLLTCHVALMVWWVVYLDVVQCCLNDPAACSPNVQF
jgi:hypothetical protein